MMNSEQSRPRPSGRETTARKNAAQAPRDVAVNSAREPDVAHALYQHELDVLLKGRLCANPKYRD